ncbi:MAG: hypothetical protein LBI44_04690 [Oscillospiraceae bacterium]|jgi:hypothetical protein|nr:hypothetical protein [Oscillospiraceae bacterium]
MEDKIILIIILVSVGIIALQLILRRLLNKGANAVERAIRKDAAHKADDLLGTAVIFETTAPLSVVRQAIAANVPVVNKIGHLMKVLQDGPDGISWSIGWPSAGNGAVTFLAYKERDGGTIAQFSITQHVTKEAISPFVNQLTELRNQIITGFKSADPGVKITTDTQEVKYKTSWF